LLIFKEAFSLLAYPDPKISPLAHLLEPSQRESVSSALNSAILGNKRSLSRSYFIVSHFSRGSWHAETSGFRSSRWLSNRMWQTHAQEQYTGLCFHWIEQIFAIECKRIIRAAQFCFSLNS